MFAWLLLAPALLQAQENTHTFDDLAVRLHAADRDSMVHISGERFHALVMHLTHKLERTPFAQWSTADHINLMRALNTTMFASLPGERFHREPYRHMDHLSDSTGYRHWAANNLGGWVPNRGMGFYFPELDMELEGTPTLHGQFNVH